MDRDRRMFGDDDFNSNNNRRFDGGNQQIPPRFNMPQQNPQFEQPFVPPTPSPIRRTNYQQNPQFIDNNSFNQQQMPGQTQMQQPAYASQPPQFSVPFQNNQHFNGNEEDFNFDYNQNYQQQVPQQDMNSKKKRGLFGFMNKKEEPVQNSSMNNVVITSPKNFQDIAYTIDMLRAGRAVIVDFKKVGDQSQQRVLDYLNGAVYALQGAQQRIGEKMFLFTPQGVCIQGPTDLKNRYDK